MPLLGFIAVAPRVQEAEPHELIRKSARAVLFGVGVVLMILGAPLALLPGHVGIFLFVIGLIMALRNSFSARRTFIRAQRRHPNIVFPIRRLIRPKPEILPVFWHQMLKFERWVLPQRMRFYRKLRRRIFRRRR